MRYTMPILALIVALLLVASQSLYRVDQRFYTILFQLGEIIETNAEILSGNQVRWHFDSRDAYPLGYPMEARSLVVQAQVQRDLLPGQPPLNRPALLDLIRKSQVARAPVVFCSSMDAAPLRKLAEEHGVAGFIPKSAGRST